MQLPLFLYSSWIKANKNTAFANRLANATLQLQMQIEFGGMPEDKNEHAFGVTDSDLWSTINYQYNQAVLEAEKFKDVDRKEALSCLEMFEKHFETYMHLLK